MIAEERRLRIRELLTVQRTLSASELTEKLGVTRATVRRDLAALEREGILVRSHGGAVSRTSNADFQPSYDFLVKANRTEKAAIAAEAERLILDGDIVFLEGSTTVYELACLLVQRKHLTVVTNSPPILSRLHQSSDVAVISTGGELQKDTHYLCGAWTQEALSAIRVDKAIFGISAIDPAYGVSTSRPAQAEIKKMLVKAAKTRIALVDHTKFGKQTFAFVGPVTDFHIIITDSETSPDYIAEVRKLGVEVVVAEIPHSEHAKSDRKVRA